MTELFFAIDRDANILFLNRAVLERNKKTAEEYAGKNHWEMWPSMKGTVVEESYRVAFATGVPVRFEFYFEPNDTWVDVSAYPYGDQLHIYFRDITDQRKAEIELTKREAELRLVLDAIPHIAWSLNPEGKVEYINARWRDFTGLDSRDQDAMRKALHPDDRDRVVAIMTRSRRTGKPEPYDVRVVTKTGSYRWLRVRWSPVLGKDGKPTRWIGTSTDVHDEVLANQALRETQDHHDFRRDASPQIPWLADADGMIYEQGAQWTALTGIDHDEISKAQYSVIHQDDVAQMTLLWNACLSSGEPFDFEHRIKVKTGDYRWMRSRAIARRDAEGKIIRWYGTTEDIHDRKVAQEALRESEERYRLLAESLEALVTERTAALAAAYKEQETFSYSVSHDLRSPLRSIVSSARILDEDYGSLLPPDAKTLLQRQAHSALRLADLIDDLLQLSRVGRKELEKEEVDITSLFVNAASLIEKPDNLVVSVKENLKGFGDARLLQLVAQNLMHNAAKFSPNGGRVTVGRHANGAFFVADQGVGFNQEYSPKLFQPFQRLHTEQEFPGTGIGLANVKRIIERHGGDVWAEAELGKGATFYFTLG